MGPVLLEINEEAVTPFLEGDIDQEEAFELAATPIKTFMAEHTREKDLALFMGYAEMEAPETLDDIPLTALVPAFALVNCKRHFKSVFSSLFHFSSLT